MSKETKVSPPVIGVRDVVSFTDGNGFTQRGRVLHINGDVVTCEMEIPVERHSVDKLTLVKKYVAPAPEVPASVLQTAVNQSAPIA